MHIVPSLSAGGAERLVFELVRLLPREGFSAFAVANLSSGPLKELFDTHDVPVRVLQHRKMFGAGSIPELMQIMKEEKPDIVHTHLFGADSWGRIAAMLSHGPKIVTTMHNVTNDYGVIRRGVHTLLSLPTSRVIAVSDIVREYLIQHDHISPSKITVVRNGIDLSRVISRPSRPFADIPTLIIVGRLMAQKGHATLFKALALVKRPWTLEVVGVGPLENDLRALAERLEIAPRIHWLGYRDDVPKLLSNADIFCFPSLWEGLGLAFLEAIAAGVPTVATSLPVLEEVMLPQKGVFVPSGDVPGFAHAIDGMLQDPVLAVQRAQAAAAEVRARFSIQRMVSEYAAVYRSLLTTSHEDSSRQ